MIFDHNGQLLSERFKILYAIRVWQKRIYILLSWTFGKTKFAKKINEKPLEFRCIKHSSKLTRIHDDTNPKHILWQENKVANLKIAAASIHGIIIKPNETFSFCKLVGRPTAKKGYLEGMELSRGEVRSGIGGGICQLANLINWMAWHTELVVTKRSHHSFDPFPDQGRVLPFGSGAAIFWNYVDLQIHNPSSQNYQILINFSSDKLQGEIRTSINPQLEYHIHEQNHKFIEKNGVYYRSNTIWRTIFKKSINHLPHEELYNQLMVKNFAKVKYKLNETHKN